MRILFKVFGGLLLLLLLAIGGASMWFWFTPVGVNNYINKVILEMAIDSPELLTSLGMIDNTPLDFHSGKLADRTWAQDDRTLAKLKKARAGLDKYGPEGLEGQELLSWRVAAWFLDDLLRQAEFDYGGYREVQISGVTVNMPRFLTDQHTIKNEKSVRRYVSRLNEFGRVLAEVKARVEDDRDHGVVPPDFIIEKSLIGMRAFIEGGATNNPLVTTLPDKLESIAELGADRKDELIAKATNAVEKQVIPGYEAMITLFEELLESTDHNAGIWRIPDGDKIYEVALKSNTTTDMSADEVHEIGLAEVTRIRAEMEAILIEQGYTDGTVTERVKALMKDPVQNFPNDDAGRQQLLDYLTKLNADVMSRAGDFFITLPDQPLEIVRVPEYSQNSAPGGYYSQPALDGSRPGRFYINLKNTTDTPRWTLPTFLYHEAAPGHHFQLSLLQKIQGLPIVRKLPLFTAFSEGWALYAERLAKEDMKLYADDPLGDLGRLQSEMFRAVRLVVDTGMHARKWSREEAIDYMAANTGMTDDEVTREIERYVVLPGQATSYKIGQIAILKMRKRAENALGDRFDLRGFHELILMNGAMPLGILDETVDDWIEQNKAP